MADRYACGEPRHATPRPNRRHAAAAWHEAARDGHLVLLLRTSRACCRLARFGAPLRYRVRVHVCHAQMIFANGTSWQRGRTATTLRMAYHPTEGADANVP